jgi:hypothetical protein
MKVLLAVGVATLVGSAASGIEGGSGPSPAAAEISSPPAIQVGRYRLQSHPWVNHQRLLYEARFGEKPPAALRGTDLEIWEKVVEGFRSFLGKRSPIFDDELVRLNAELSAMEEASLPASIPKTAATSLEAAMPLYRAVQWEEDDRANRFWIAVGQPLRASAGEELAADHTKAYGVPFPSRVRVDVTSFAWEFGAYTVGKGDSAHAVIASTVAGRRASALSRVSCTSRLTPSWTRGPERSAPTSRRRRRSWE